MLALALVLQLAASAPGEATSAAGQASTASVPADASASATPRPATPITDFAYAALAGLSVSPEQARTLGKFIREDVKTYPSDWIPGEIVEMHTVALDGLALDIASHQGRGSFLVSATFTKASWKLPRGLSVGAPEARVLEVLGQPGERAGNVLLYQGDADGCFVEFTVAGGVVAKVTITPYTG